MAFQGKTDTRRAEGGRNSSIGDSLTPISAEVNGVILPTIDSHRVVGSYAAGVRGNGGNDDETDEYALRQSIEQQAPSLNTYEQMRQSSSFAMTQKSHQNIRNGGGSRTRTDTSIDELALLNPNQLAQAVVLRKRK